MPADQNPKILRLVKVILDILFWLLVGASVFLLAWIAFSPLILNLTGISIMSSVPVSIGTGPDPRIPVEVVGAETKGIQAAYVDEAQGTLRLETTDWYLIFVSNLAKLLTAIGLAYLVYLLRSVVMAIGHQEVFTPENVSRIRRLGFLVLIVALAKAFVEYVAANEILRQLTIESPPLGLPSNFDAGVILASLLILVLAQVWSYGLELERDRALTI
jgi:hypothetical protein